MRLLPVVSSLIAVSACFGSTEPLSSDTGALVRVSLWPIDPVEIEGQPSRTRPAAGARVVVLDDDGNDVARATTDDQGMARIHLAPGSYTVTVVECPGAMSLPKENAQVTVADGSFAEAALACDTGIR